MLGYSGCFSLSYRLKDLRNYLQTSAASGGNLFSSSHLTPCLVKLLSESTQTTIKAHSVQATLDSKPPPSAAVKNLKTISAKASIHPFPSLSGISLILLEQMRPDKNDCNLYSGTFIFGPHFLSFFSQIIFLFRTQCSQESAFSLSNSTSDSPNWISTKLAFSRLLTRTCQFLLHHWKYIFKRGSKICYPSIFSTLFIDLFSRSEKVRPL